MVNDTVCYRVIHTVFGSERNFLNTGLLYVTIGYYLVKNEKYGCTELLKDSKIEFIEMQDNYGMKVILNNFFKNKR